MILIIDNYDSFVFNIARYLTQLGAETRVIRNDRLDIRDAERLGPKAVVVSPGPCTPKEAGASLDLIRALSGKVPILGICLGHQCIGEAFGGRIVRAKTPMHGRAAAISHDGTGLFQGLPQPLQAGRYHSLIVALKPGGPLEANAWSEGEIMAVKHRDHPTFGVQFHPESILTEHGYDLFKNFLEMTA